MSGEAGAGWGLADQGLAVDFDTVHPEDADHDVDEHGTDGEDDNDGDDGAALVVVLGLAADSPEQGVGEQVEDIQKVQHSATLCSKFIEVSHIHRTIKFSFYSKKY